MINRSDFAGPENIPFPTVRPFFSPNRETRPPILIPDTESQLENRHRNAPLLRYVDSMRTHGHRAARIDPLDLIHREEVAALDPKRYGLVDESQKYNVNGILWTKPVGSSSDAEEEWWTLGEIERHLRNVYVARIAHEVCTTKCCNLQAYMFTICSICTRLPKLNVSGSRIFWNRRHSLH
jgi:2-oxoglutarate dehydrogenase complex dehydrogenase (E1) component-like enzyme